MLQKYELIIDNKVKIWRRDKVTIFAETISKAIDRAKSGDYDYVYDTEYLSGTESYLDPNNEDGDITCEIMNTSGKRLWTNELE